jgi:hypothetical protein
MPEVTTHRSINEALVDLEQVLQEERTALLSLDATSIDELNQRKADIESALSGYAGELSLEQQDCLSQLRLKLRNNLILLIHARDHIQARLGMERPPVVQRPTSRPVVGGTRLNLRG